MGISLTNNNQGGYVRMRRTSPSISGAGAWCGNYLLNAYPGAVAAYSLRKLRKEYNGPLIRVRRSSDNAETDIGYVFSLDGQVLDEQALTSFVGAGDGFITKWYDQSGNSVDQARTISNRQPQIVASGTVYKDNSRPAMYFNGSMSMRSVISVSLTSVAGEWSSFGVVRCIEFSQARVLLSFHQIPNIGQFIRSGPPSNPAFQSVAFNTVNQAFGDSSTLNNTNQNILNSIRRTNNVEMFVNGASNGATVTTGTPTTGITPLDVGYRDGMDFGNFLPFGYIQELLHYPSDSTSFYQQAINDINSFYKVY